jgi:hypothetical protein
MELVSSVAAIPGGRNPAEMDTDVLARDLMRPSGPKDGEGISPRIHMMIDTR